AATARILGDVYDRYGECKSKFVSDCRALFGNDWLAAQHRAFLERELAPGDYRARVDAEFALLDEHPVTVSDVSAPLLVDLKRWRVQLVRQNGVRAGIRRQRLVTLRVTEEAAPKRWI